MVKEKETLETEVTEYINSIPAYSLIIAQQMKLLTEYLKKEEIIKVISPLVKVLLQVYISKDLVEINNPRILNITILSLEGINWKEITTEFYEEILEK